jgi:DNA repair protein RecO (recombination protein O)
MEWSDEGIVLSARKHGESSVIVSLFTRCHGRHLGLVRGGSGSKARGVYQPGNRVTARWRARLSEHLGAYACELTHGTAALVMDDPLSLAALSAACSVVESTLPERESHEALWQDFSRLVAALETGDWPRLYVSFEIGLLGELGYGLDLSRCAVSGASDDLVWVSPKSGRAVSGAAAGPYEKRLLRLPPFLRPGGPEAGAETLGAVSEADVLDGLALSGHFLDRYLLLPHERVMPAARIRFVDRYRRLATTSGNMPGK